MTRTTSLGIVVLALTLAGCTAETGPEPKPVVSSAPNANETTSAPNAKETTPSPEPIIETKRGSMMFVAALKEPIGLASDQRRTIEGLLASLPDTPSPGISAMAAVTGSSEMDEARVEAIFSAALHDTVEPLVKPTAALHATLTKAQRLALKTALWSRPPQLKIPHEMDVRKQETVGASSARRAPPRLDFADIGEKILVGHRARLDRFAADDFDVWAFVTPQIDFKPVAAKLVKLPLDARSNLHARIVEKWAAPAIDAPPH